VSSPPRSRPRCRRSRPTVTRVLARLEERGLIERMADPQDRRSSLVTTTAAGRALLAELRTRKTAFLAHRIERLTPAERETLDRAAGILERMLAE
jgi:DNA-binding MarR family transcriptional regulator